MEKREKEQRARKALGYKERRGEENWGSL